MRVVPSCGYDSIPSDIGSLYTVSQFNKPVKRIDLYQEMQGGASGGTIETVFTMGKLSKEQRSFSSKSRKFCHRGAKKKKKR